MSENRVDGSRGMLKLRLQREAEKWVGGDLGQRVFSIPRMEK